MADTYTSLSFHAEALHEDRVWTRTRKMAGWMSRRGISATFFVYPFRAQVRGVSIDERVRELAGLGHEIGQHTHFYAGTNIDKETGKKDDLSASNIDHCLRRDHETLISFGAEPKGFAAGAWVAKRSVLQGIAKLGFTYDCSGRWPESGGKARPADRQFLRSPEVYVDSNAKLLSLPTTCSLGEWFKWGRSVKTDSPLPYQLVYLHDYDLLRRSQYALLRFFLVLTRRRRFLPAGQLAVQVEKLLDPARG